MLVEELQPFFEAQPEGYDQPATFYLTINKTRARNTWSAGYQDYATGKILIAINHAESLDEVAIRLQGRLERYNRQSLPKPRRLRDLPKRDTVGSTNVMEAPTMSDLTHGQKLVGINFNPAQNPNVQRLKQLAAEQIDLLERIQYDRLTAAADSKADYDTNTVHGEAIRQIMSAQMWAVKDATWGPALPNKPDEAGNTADPLNQRTAANGGSVDESNSAEPDPAPAPTQ